MRRREQGLTLIELMIVVALIGILGAVGWSQYRKQLDRGIRGDAVSALTRAAVEMETCHNQAVPNSYADCTLTNMGTGTCSDKNLKAGNTIIYSPNCQWQITIGTPDTDSYTLAATRTYTDASGASATDVLTLDQLGRKTGPWPQ